MVTEADREEAVRELRLEGLGLFVAAGILLAGLVGAFWLGRWYERQTTPAGGAGVAAELDPLSRVETRPDAEASEDLTFFDTLPEGGSAEPKREAAGGAARPQEEAGRPAPGEAVAAPAEAPQGGDWYVQVFAGRDRQSAEALVGRLRGQGYRPQLDSRREGQGRLFKVRVGGYPDRDGAQAAADKLRGEGYPGSWVTRVD